MPPGNKPQKRHIRPVERQPMKEWLIEHLDSGELAGLIWVDRTEGIFKIKWCHGSRHSWNKNDIDVFERWAQFTGRHYHGSEKDPKRWKPNFRCALNSLKTVKPLEKSLKGSNAFRLFQILAFSGNKSYVKKEGNIREQRASKEGTRQRRSLREESSTSSTDEEREMEEEDTEIAAMEADIKETVGGIPEREEIINWNINISAPVPKIELPNFEKISPGLGADFEYGKRHTIKNHNCGYIVTQCSPDRLEQESLPIQQYSQVAQNPDDSTVKNGYNCPDTPEDKIRLDVSSESSARQRIHLKNQALFSSKDENSVSSPTSIEPGNLNVGAEVVAQSIEIFTSADDSNESNDVSSISDNGVYQDHFPLTPPYESYPCQEQSIYEADNDDHSRAIPKNIIISQ